MSPVGTVLSTEELTRYSRHLIIPEVGMQGQLKLKEAKVLCLGAGGLGAPLALYLAAAGVGTLGLVDFDTVEYTNLQRQILYGTSDVGKSKLEVASKKLHEINPDIKLISHDLRLSSKNAFNLFQSYDIIADGTDNFATRYLVNDACVLTGKPYVYGSILRFEGQVSVFDARQGPCYRCLYPEPPSQDLAPSCADSGVVGALPGVVGTLQALEVIKLILNQGESLTGRLLLFDALKMKFRELRLSKDSACVICGEKPAIRELMDYEPFCGIPRKEEAMANEFEITPEELKQLRDKKADIAVLDVRESWEWDICHFPEAKLIPVKELPNRLNELDRNQDIVVHCRSGGRSAKAVELLKKSGFTRVKNLAGGITAWAERIDPSVPTY